MKKPTLLYIKKFSKLNEETAPIENESKKSNIPGEWIDPYKSPYKNLSSLDEVEGPDGRMYNIKQMKVNFNVCKNAISMVYPATSYFLSIMMPPVITFEVPTMATDGLRLFVNPCFFNELIAKAGAPGVIFVLLHEVFHNLYRHLQRGKELGHNPIKSNIAGDYEINLALEQLEDDDGVRAFEGTTNKIGGLIDQIYDKMSYEKIYDSLKGGNMDKPISDDFGEGSNDVIKLDPKYKDGYRDGWNKAIEELRGLGLVESFVRTFNFNNFINESNVLPNGINTNTTNPYNAGFTDGYSKAMEKIKALKNGATIEISGSSQVPQGSGLQGPQVEQIDGLDPIRPKFPINIKNDSNLSGKQQSGSSDNEPLEVDVDQNKQNQQNQQNQNGSGSQSGQGQSSQNGSQSGNNSSKPGKDAFGEVDYEKRGSRNGSSDDSEEGEDSGQDGQQSGQGQSGQNGSQSGQGQSSSQSGQSSSQSGQGQSSSQSGQSSQNGSQSGQGQDGQNNQNGQNQSSNGPESYNDTDKTNALNDPTNNMKRVTKVTSGYGTNGNLYKDGQLIKEGDGRQASNGDIIPKEIGDDIVKSDGSWSKWKKHMGTDPENIWKRALDSHGKEVIKELRGHGCSTADALEEMMNSWEPPTQDWKRILKRYLKGMYEEIIDKMPKKKGVDREIYRKYQKKRGESGKDIIYLVDVSGSMSNEDLRQCLREINGIAEDIKVKRAWIIQCDTEIKWDSIDQLRPEKKRDTRHALEMFTRRGMGGTDFDQPFEWITNEFIPKHGIPNCVIVLTDGDVEVPKKPKTWSKNVIWFITKGGNDRFNPGYGKKLYWKTETTNDNKK